MEALKTMSDARDRALRLLRALRVVDERAGVKNSRIAFDVALLFFEGTMAQPPRPISVDQIADATGYSGPTVRLVLKRLMDAGKVISSRRVGKTQLYEMTAEGRESFSGYVDTLEEFRAG